MGPVKTLNLFCKVIYSSYLLCVIWGCARNIEANQSKDNSIYILCLKDILKESLVTSDSITKDLFLINRLNRNYGLISELYLNDIAVKDLVNKDSTWGNFIKQIDIQNILKDTLAQQSGSIPSETSLTLKGINIVTMESNDSINQYPKHFWLSHKERFLKSIGIVGLSRILYSTDKGKAMLTITRLTGRLNGVTMLYFVNVTPIIEIKFQKELEVM
ncbi:MAG: hypothetical protein ACKO96_36465 [Flammeovirgaceae bacterium]